MKQPSPFLLPLYLISIPFLIAGCGLGGEGNEVDREKRVKEAKKAAVSARKIYDNYVEKMPKGKQDSVHEMEGRYYYVRGAIDTIRENVMGEPFMNLTLEGTAASIQCFMKADSVLEKLKSGDELIVFGMCDRLHMDINIVFTKCRVAWHPDKKDLYLRQEPLMGDDHYREKEGDL